MIEFVLLAYNTAFAALLMLTAHYLAPRIAGQDIQPPRTYAIGVGIGIGLPYAAWMLTTVALTGTDALNVWLVLGGFAAIVAGAGAGTGIGYGIDAWLGLRADVRTRRS